LFDMYYRIGSTCRRPKRWGYFVLPVLRDDRLVGRSIRVGPSGHVSADQRLADAGRHERRDRDAMREAIDELGAWLRVDRVEVPRARL
jgi:uncharacterized protein YcaQ